MVCKYANEKWVKEDAFVKKEDYFQFAKIIANQIANS